MSQNGVSSADRTIYLPKPEFAVEGPGGVEARFDFRGTKNTAAGQVLTASPTNDLDGHSVWLIKLPVCSGIGLPARKLNLEPDAGDPLAIQVRDN